MSGVRLALTAFVLAASACGSTANSGRGTLTAADDGLSVAGDGLRLESPSTGGTANTDRSTRTPGFAASAGGHRSIPGRGTESDGSKEVKVGVYYAEDANDALAAVGAQSTVPNLRTASDILVKDINARGGIEGRKLVAVHHPIRLSEDRPTEDQGACEDFTKDRPVTAVISTGFASQLLAECLAKAGIAYVYSGLTTDNAATFTRYPLQSEPISMNLDRVARNQVEALVAQNYLRHAKGSRGEQVGLPVKLGIVVLDQPNFRDVYQRVLAPAYKAKGTPVSEVFYVRADTAGLAADMDAAVLAFSQRNVTHVSFLTTAGLPPGLFVVRAHTQRYEPRYGFSSQDAMQIVWEDNIRQIFGDSAKTQFRGALGGVGWMPLGDVANPTAPGTAPATYKHCIETMRRGGLPPRDTNYNLLMTYTCDGFWFLDAAFEAGGAGSVSASSLLAGVNALGSRYLPATVSSTRTGPGRHDGVGSIRHFAFFDDCSCFRYTSQPVDV